MAATWAIWLLLLLGAEVGAALAVIKEASELIWGFICKSDAKAVGGKLLSAASGLLRLRFDRMFVAGDGVALDVAFDDLFAVANGDGFTLGQGVA